MGLFDGASGLGTIAGAGIGFFAGGPAGAMMGASLGGTLGGALDGSLNNKFDAHGAPLVASFNQGDISNANTQASLAQQQQEAFAKQAMGQNGFENQDRAYRMALQQAQGVGPNPAQQALANATQANTANQAALMAGQRGSSANAGLMARQVANQGSNIQQQGAGQAALMQAQQQLAGQQMAAQLANQQVDQQQQAIMQNNQAAQGLQGNILGAVGNYNNASVGNTSSTNQINSGIATGNNNRQAGMLGGLLGAAGSMGSMFGGAGATPTIEPSAMGAGTATHPIARAHGGMISDSNCGSNLGKHIMAMKAGGAVPGQAKVAGDSTKNDNVHALLSPGEAVIPRSVMMSKNPPQAAAKFVAALLAKRK